MILLDAIGLLRDWVSIYSIPCVQNIVGGIVFLFKQWHFVLAALLLVVAFFMYPKDKEDCDCCNR